MQDGGRDRLGGDGRDPLWAASGNHRQTEWLKKSFELNNISCLFISLAVKSGAASDDVTAGPPDVPPGPPWHRRAGGVGGAGDGALAAAPAAVCAGASRR